VIYQPERRHSLAPVGECHIRIFGKVRRGSFRANLKFPIGGAVLGMLGTCVTRQMIGMFQHARRRPATA
jgi:hypothetical protein